MTTIVYSARRIVTMNPNRPFATHVAVRDGRILALQLLYRKVSESMGNHDSKIVDWDSVD